MRLNPLFRNSLLTALVILLAADIKALGQIRFPEDAGLVNVRDHGVQGDGKTDDTAAVQRVFDQFNGSGAVIYFPAGTYVISDTIRWQGRFANTILQGQGQAHTIIRLADRAPGFGDASKPKPMFYTGGPPAQRFRNAVRDLTLDIGEHNPGGVALNFCANNQGIVRDLTVRAPADGSGAVGLALDQGEVGPLMVKNLTVIGFDVGIRVRQSVNSVTLEDVRLENQRKVGIDNHNNLVFVRKLTSRNSVPAVINDGPDAVFLLVDSTLEGGSTGAAIRNVHERAQLFARNITSTGYAHAIEDAYSTSTVDHAAVRGEWVSQAPIMLFPTEARSLNLPVEETPDVPWGDVSKWVNVQDFGANPTDNRDDTEAIQKAIDSGAETIYFPRGVQLPPQQRGSNPGWRGTYQINDTIHIRANVKRLIGFEAAFYFQPKPDFPEGAPVFHFGDGTAPVVVVERLQFMIGNAFPNPAFIHASQRDLVLQSFTGARTLVHRGKGRLFVEDVVGDQPWKLEPGSRLFARQLNIEGERTEEPKLVNTGGVAWVLGFKTEHRAPVMGTYAGGRTEVLGAHFYTCVKDSPDKILIDVQDAQMSVAGAGEYAWTPSWATNTVLRETRDGQTRTLHKDALVRRGGGSMLPLVVSGGAWSAPSDAPPVTSPKVTVTEQTAASVRLAIAPAADVAGYRIERDGRLVGLRRGNFVETQLAPSTDFTYVVTAFDRFGRLSEPVNVSAKTSADLTAPTTPTGLETMVRSHRRVQFRWKASQDELGVAGYTVERLDADGQATVMADAQGTLEFDDTRITRGATYTYRVTAFDKAGNRSEPATIEVRVPTEPSAEEVVELERASRRHKLVQVKGWFVGNLSGGLWLTCEDIELGRDKPFDRVALRYALPPTREGAEIDLFLNATVEGYEERPGKTAASITNGEVKGRLLGTFVLKSTGGFDKMAEVVLPIDLSHLKPSEIASVTLRVRRANSQASNALGDLDKLRFFRLADDKAGQ